MVCVVQVEVSERVHYPHLASFLLVVADQRLNLLLWVSCYRPTFAALIAVSPLNQKERRRRANEALKNFLATSRAKKDIANDTYCFDLFNSVESFISACI